MSKANYYTQKKDYIKILNDAFSPLMDFGSISYVHLYGTEQEYIRVGDSVGCAKFLNVTASDLESILLDVMAVVVGQNPKSLISDMDDKRKVASLF